MARYRILSLDGGGIRGLLSIAILQELEKKAAGWLNEVDLIAGTSTGGIIAIALAHGMTLAQLRHLYYEKGPFIFEDSPWDNLRDLYGLRGAQYGTDNLRHELQRVLQETRLRELKRKVLISAFDMHDPVQGTWKPKFFHNFEGPDSDGDELAYLVALYTSAAPTYFPWVNRYIDGGVVANNPSMAALSQTRDERNAPSNFRDGRRPILEEVRLLSVGTGKVPQHVEGKNRDWGYLQWVKWRDQKPLIDIALQGVAGVADYHCQQILGEERYRRVSPVLPRPIDMDDWEARDELIHIAEKAVELDGVAAWLESAWK